MKGSAPNSPDTGSQVVPRQKPRPNLAIESREWRHSSNAMPATSSTTSTPNRPVPSRKSRSSALRRGEASFDMGGFPRCCLDFDPLDRFHLETDDALRHRSVAQVFGELLAVGHRPFDEVDHDLPALLVFRAFVEEQPGERRD